MPGAKLDVVGSGKFQPGIADGDALVTIAQTNTNAYVHAGIKINAGNTNPFYIYQSGSSNTLRFNYNSLADAGGQLVITDSGNVGIGTTSPGYTLEIAGPSTTSFAYQRTGVSANKWGFHSDNDATYWQNLTSGNLLFTLQNGGNVGIGTTSPDSLLTVSGSSLQNSNNAGIELSNSHNAQTVLLIENTTSRKYEVAVGGSANSIGNGSFYIYDGTAGAARLVIDSSGNVGIGTNSPSQDLTLYRSSGDTNFLISSNNGASQIFFGDTESDNIGKIDYDHSDNSLSLVVNAAERMRIEADGQVSLRTAGAHLMFQNTVGTAPYIANAGTGYADLTIATGGSERIRITSAGRVEVTGNVLSIDNVDEYRQDFTTTGSSTPSFDIDLKSIGASGQPFEVFVAWTHYSTAYGAGLHQAYYQRSTVQSDITLIHTYFNQTSTNGGAWSVVWLTGTEIRVQKSAGSHAGTGYGYIRVTRLKP